MGKEKYINKVAKTVKLTIEDCERALNSKTLWVNNESIALTINWLRKRQIMQRRNKKSNKLLIKWLKSEMRLYGSCSVLVWLIVNRFYFLTLEQMKKK